MIPPWFPVPLEKTASRKRYVDLDGGPLALAGIEIATANLQHPQGVTAFRLKRGERSIVLATDVEMAEPDKRVALCDLASGADVLIHDAQYTPEQYAERRGWGHSTWYAAVQLAVTAGVGTLVLFHHHPEHTDDELTRVLEVTRGEFPSTEIAREGLELDL